jgi:hypothetical protein
MPTNSLDKLSPKARQFFKLYTDEHNKPAYLNATESAFQVYNCKSRTSAQAIGYALVKKYFATLRPEDIKPHLTPEFIVGRLLSLANDSRRDGDKLRALELLGKTMAMFKDSVEKKDITVDKPKSLDEIDKEYSELVSRRQPKANSVDKS